MIFSMFGRPEDAWQVGIHTLRHVSMMTVVVFGWVGTLSIMNNNPWEALSAIIFGSFGLGAVALYRTFMMARLQVRAESERIELSIRAERDKMELANLVEARRIELNDLNQRLSESDRYCRVLQDKLREASNEAAKWRTLYDLKTTPSPPASEPK